MTLCPLHTPVVASLRHLDHTDKRDATNVWGGYTADEAASNRAYRLREAQRDVKRVGNGLVYTRHGEGYSETYRIEFSDNPEAAS